MQNLTLTQYRLTPYLHFLRLLTLFIACGLVMGIFIAPLSLAAPPLVTTGADNTTVDGLCSLREAILSANGTPVNGDCTTGINITFDPLVTTVTINSGAPLPDITAKGVIIDGQNTVTIAGAAGAGDGLTIRASNVRISRLALGGFPGNGIVIRGQNTKNVTLNALKVGFDSINMSLGNGVNGLLISNGAHDNNIGLATAGGVDRNTFSNNGQHGIEIRGRNDPNPAQDTRNNVVIANNIGISPDGTLAAANQDNGIVIIDGANSNTIGGGSSDERNVISFNPGDGVSISGARTINNVIIGNSIGGDFNGAVEFPNANGVRLSNNANNNTIGAGNFIVFNAGIGVILESSAFKNRIENNTIAQNGTHGLFLTGAASGNRLQNNGISQNGANGISLTGASTGNKINKNTLTQNTANGILIDGNGTNNNRIRQNTIANNGEDGVAIVNTAVGNFISRNSMVNNQQLGIDLGNDGVTANDPNDPDNGANNLQNFPQSMLAVDTGTETLLAGIVNSTVNPPFRVEAFTTAAGDDEGVTFLGSVSNMTNNTPFMILLPTGLLGETLVTTASSSINSTSEFSPIVTVFQLQANFTAVPLTGNFPLLVNFTDTSLNTTGLPLSYQWNYGDNSAFDTIANPSHTFTAPGTYRVKLTVCISNGVITLCDTFKRKITVTSGS